MSTSVPATGWPSSRLLIRRLGTPRREHERLAPARGGWSSLSRLATSHISAPARRIYIALNGALFGAPASSAFIHAAALTHVVHRSQGPTVCVIGRWAAVDRLGRRPHARSWSRCHDQFIEPRPICRLRQLWRDRSIRAAFRGLRADRVGGVPRRLQRADPRRVRAGSAPVRVVVSAARFAPVPGEEG